MAGNTSRRYSRDELGELADPINRVGERLDQAMTTVAALRGRSYSGMETVRTEMLFNAVDELVGAIEELRQVVARATMERQ